MKKLTICIAAAAILALPASASAASQFFGGKISNGGKIGVDVTTVSGDPFQIDAMAYKNLPASCTGGPFLVSGTWTFTNALVTNNKFTIDGTSGMGDNVFFKGTFKRGGRKLEGRIQEGPSDYGPPAGTCTSANRPYDAKRGDKGPHPQPKAKIARAFRVAG
jgi:hypothetical protein